MGLLRVLRLCILCLVLSLLCSITKCGGSDVSVKFLKAPHAFSQLNSATFAFEVPNCSNCCCCHSCKLDDGIGSDCANREVTYSNLLDGNHSFEVCTIGHQGLGCAYYNWTVDTIPPTAYVAAPTYFTSSLNVSVNITFSEPCIGGGFGCKSVNACNLLVYGAGQVIPSSLSILQPNLMYSLLVSLSSIVQYGQAILEMDKNFCTDIAGNSFTRMPNSSVYIHFDRRKVDVSLSTPIPLLQLDSENRTVQATNDYNKLVVYLYFSAPVLNSSTEIMNSLNISQGLLLPTSAESLGNRRFGFRIANISSTAIISVDFNSKSIITRQGTQVSPIAPVTFLYDSTRPAVNLSTYSMRTREPNIQILIKFVEPVFGFNTSCISISGGLLKSFHEISRSTYIVEVQANDDLVFVSVLENVTSDVVGNKNLASNFLPVRHYSVPVISSVVSAFTTASFVLTLIAAGLLTIATESLQSVGTFTADPARNLFRIMSHIQVFALSSWLAVKLPVEFSEFARHLQWTIPYFSVPWEAGHMNLSMVGSSPFGSSNSFTKASATITNTLFDKSLSFTASVYGSLASKKKKVPGSPFNSSEYQQYFQSQNMKPEAEYLDSQHSSGWTDFYRSMFWLAVICGGVMVLHAFLHIILKFGKRNSGKHRIYGALTFPRFEIFLLSLALPSICKASAVLIRGGAPSAVAVGILLLVFVFIMLLALFLFLSVGITFGRLLQYKERGQWTWKEQPKSVYLSIFGPLFEDLRGPPKNMLSQISGGNLPSQRGSIIASDETEDAEAPFIQKLFGILRIYYVLLESIRRVSLGILAGIFIRTQSFKSPVIIMLSISSFQLFFIVLTKPFKNKKVQLVEIISLTCEVALFATCLVLLKKEDPSVRTETKFGIFMLVLFLVGYCPQITNEWHTLSVQTRLLDPEEKSLLTGMKIASIGCLRYIIPQKYIKNLEKWLPQNGNENEETQDTALETDRHRHSGSRSSGTPKQPWLKQLRELTKASFGRERSSAPTDPSTSGTTRWSGFWGTKRSGSSSSDSKSKPNTLYKDHGTATQSSRGGATNGHERRQAGFRRITPEKKKKTDKEAQSEEGNEEEKISEEEENAAVAEKEEETEVEEEEQQQIEEEGGGEEKTSEEEENAAVAEKEEETEVEEEEQQQIEEEGGGEEKENAAIAEKEEETEVEEEEQQQIEEEGGGEEKTEEEEDENEDVVVEEEKKEEVEKDLVGKQLREPAKASFGRKRSSAPTDPSTSGTTRWSGFWGTKRSGSSSSDSKSKPNTLYKGHGTGIQSSSAGATEATNGREQRRAGFRQIMPQKKKKTKKEARSEEGKKEEKISEEEDNAAVAEKEEETEVEEEEEQQIEEEGGGEEKISEEEENTAVAEKEEETEVEEEQQQQIKEEGEGEEKTEEKEEEEDENEDEEKKEYAVAEEEKKKEAEKDLVRKQLREPAKASFGRKRSSAPTDPSTSGTTRWSGFWGTKRSGSSSSDSKSKPNTLYKGHGTGTQSSRAGATEATNGREQRRAGFRRITPQKKKKTKKEARSEEGKKEEKISEEEEENAAVAEKEEETEVEEEEEGGGEEKISEEEENVAVAEKEGGTEVEEEEEQQIEEEGGGEEKISEEEENATVAEKEEETEVEEEEQQQIEEEGGGEEKIKEKEEEEDENEDEEKKEDAVTEEEKKEAEKALVRKQLREPAKASFGRKRSSAPTDPSTSGTTRWSGFWGTKRSGSSSSDSKSKPNTMYKDRGTTTQSSRGGATEATNGRERRQVGFWRIMPGKKKKTEKEARSEEGKKEEKISEEEENAAIVEKEVETEIVEEENAAVAEKEEETRVEEEENAAVAEKEEETKVEEEKQQQIEEEGGGEEKTVMGL